jgi:hypothetical protein
MFKALFAGAILALVNTGVFAATVLVNGSTATAVLNLDVAGVFYDVTFEHVSGTVNPITGFGPGDIFAGNAGASQQAVNAINQALEGAGLARVGAGTSGSGANTYVVPYQFGQGCQDFCAYRGFNSGNPNWLTLDSDVDELADIEFARFTVSVAAVPVPPALYLFASGLAMLGAARKRRHHDGGAG